MMVTFEFWTTRYLFIRKDYGFLDWLSGIGGLLSLLILIAGGFIGLFVTNGPHVFTSSALTAGK